MTHIGHLALSFSVSANNKVLTILSATLPQPPGLHYHHKIFASGDIFSGLEIGCNHWVPSQMSAQNAAVLRSPTHVEHPDHLVTNEVEHCYAT